MFDTPGSFLAAIRQNKNRRHVAQLFGSVYLSAGGSILVSGVDPFYEPWTNLKLTPRNAAALGQYAELVGMTPLCRR